MTAEFLAAISGVVISLAFSYIPGFSKWFGSQDEDRKRLIMLGVLLLTGLAVLGISCSGYAPNFGLKVACNESGAIELLKAFGVAAVANQTAYKLTPKSKSRAFGRGVA